MKHSAEISLAADTEATSVWRPITSAAIFIAIAVVLARSTMLEFLRDVFPVLPGTKSAPRDAGATTILVLDLLAALPALLVLLRASIDSTFRLRKSLGNVLMLGLIVWAAISVSWANDRFAASIDVATVAAALSILWATQQIVRDWRTLRLVAAIAVAMLMIYAVHGVIDKYVELPARQENFKQNEAQMLKQMNVEPGSFSAERLMKKIGNGELLGFGASINTFAAVMVMCGVIGAGVIVQRIVNRDRPEPVIALGVMMVASIPVLIWTSCRAAIGTPIIAGGIIAVFGLGGAWLARKRRSVAIAILLAGAAVVAFMVHHGLKTGTMFQDSLNFRWRYWAGSWGVWLEHPAIGVGFDSFSFHYLAHRLPIASEEIKDPHNFIVRAFVELGVVGGVLTILWVGRAFWEMSFSRRLSEVEPPPSKLSDVGWIGLIVLAGMVLGLIASADFSHPDWNLSIDLLKRLLYLCVGVIGAALVALQSMERQVIDARPAPWIRLAMIAGMIAFLVHNLIDFAMFENSAMFMAALIAGAAWGSGLHEPAVANRGFAVVRLALAAVAWLLVLGVLVGPVAIAESWSQQGDDLLRSADESTPARFIEAAQSYAQAMQHGPSNAEYALNAARALALAPLPSVQAIGPLLNAAVADNPFSTKCYLTRAQFDLRQAPPDLAAARQDYQRALELDPCAVDIRLEYADVLFQLNEKPQAREQYQRALWYNDQLSPDEPKRLNETQLQTVKDKIARCS